MELSVHTSGLQERLGWWTEPGADANGIGQSREASEAIPERCPEDVGVEGLYFRPVNYNHGGIEIAGSGWERESSHSFRGTYVDKRHACRFRLDCFSIDGDSEGVLWML
jgi:hypothetical protein